MKGVMKGKMMKKLKSIKPIEYLKADKILQASNFDEFVESFPIKGNLKPFKFPTFKEQDSKRWAWSKTGVPKEPIQTVDVDELLREVEAVEKAERKEKEREIISKDEFAEEEEEEEEEEDKENIRPSISNQNAENSVSSEDKHRKQSTPFINSEPPKPVSETGISSFRRPDMNSRTLFDPNLLAAFQEALIQHNRAQEEKLTAQSEKTEQPERAGEGDDEEEEESFPLLNFEEKCPPGGIYSVILYTTSLRGIRKTFEDCHSVRFLLESFRVIFQERDISIHAEFREELWTTLGKKSVPPRLFIMGRYIGGAEEVLSLNEQGRLKPLFEGVPRKQRDCTCEGCGGFRFVVCMNCNGSTRVFDCEEEEEEDGDGGGGLFSRRKCTECNENGLIFCPYCF